MDNGVVDTNLAAITEFMSIEEYNKINATNKGHIRLLFESLYDALKVLKDDGVTEVSFNEDQLLWAYGAVGSEGKVIVGIKRPATVPMFDTTQTEKIIKKYLVKKDSIGRKSKVEIKDDYHITEMDEIIEEIVERPKKIEKNEDGLMYLDNIDPDKAMKTLATLYRTQVHELNPILEVEIPYLGHRFSGMMKPCQSETGFSIRTRPKKIYSLDDYIEQGSITESQKLSLLQYIQQKKNILVVGGTGSGKTTFCNALLKAVSELDPLSRVIIIEDVRELQCEVKDKAYMTVPPPNLEGDDSTAITTARLLRSAMRRSPERICVGEVRDGETALNLLSAWNSGHPGGICTIHADDAIGGIDKLEQYIIMSNKTPNRQMISRTVNVVVSIQASNIYDRDTCKWRKVRRVEEIKSVEQYVEATGKYYFQDL